MFYYKKLCNLMIRCNIVRPQRSEKKKNIRIKKKNPAKQL